MSAVSYGYCECGCGEKTRVPTKSSKRDGDIRGVPKRFIQGHNGRRTPEPYLEDESGCWIWQRQVAANGYGRLTVNGKHWQAHRFYYTEAKGAIPDGLEIDHLCRNTRCVNPDHLEAVTPTENHRRSRATKLTLANAREIRDARGTASTSQLAARFGVTPTMVRYIWRGTWWRDVAEAA